MSVGLTDLGERDDRARPVDEQRRPGAGLRRGHDDAAVVGDRRIAQADELAAGVRLLARADDLLQRAPGRGHEDARAAARAGERRAEGDGARRVDARDGRGGERLDRDAGADVVAFAHDRLDRHRAGRERPEHAGIAVAPVRPEGEGAAVAHGRAGDGAEGASRGTRLAHLHQGLDAPGDEEPVAGARDAGTVADAAVGRDAQQAQRGEYEPGARRPPGARYRCPGAPGLQEEAGVSVVEDRGEGDLTLGPIGNAGGELGKGPATRSRLARRDHRVDDVSAAPQDAAPAADQEGAYRDAVARSERRRTHPRHLAAVGKRIAGRDDVDHAGVGPPEGSHRAAEERDPSIRHHGHVGEGRERQAEGRGGARRQDRHRRRLERGRSERQEQGDEGAQRHGEDIRGKSDAGKSRGRARGLRAGPPIILRRSCATARSPADPGPKSLRSARAAGRTPDRARSSGHACRAAVPRRRAAARPAGTARCRRSRSSCPRACAPRRGAGWWRTRRRIRWIRSGCLTATPAGAATVRAATRYASRKFSRMPAVTRMTMCSRSTTSPTTPPTSR